MTGLREYNRRLRAERHLHVVPERPREAPEPSAVPVPVAVPETPFAPALRSTCAHCVERPPVGVFRDGAGRRLHLCAACVPVITMAGPVAFVPDRGWQRERGRSIA